MRRLAILSALAFFGCSDNALPIEGTTSTGGTSTGGTTGGTTTGGTTTGGTTTGGTTTGGTTTGGTTTGGTTTGGTNGGTTGTGGQGDACKTACDCVSGLACFQGMCTKTPQGALYCCDNQSDCPGGQFCQGSDGMFGMCDSTTGSGSTGGTTGGSGCMTACDCPTGEACFQNMCVAAPQGKLFCCDDTTNCPSGQFCQSSQGNFMMCGGGGGTTGGTNGGTGGTTGGSMCMATKCMMDSDCAAAGCNNGCSKRRGMCR